MDNNIVAEIFKKWGAVADKKLIMISGPYTHATKTSEERQKNLDRLNRVAFEVFNKGYIPIVAVNMALPIVQINHLNNDIMMPMALAIVTKCDCLLRLDGPSSGADDETALMLALGRKVYYSVEEIPVSSNPPYC